MRVMGVDWVGAAVMGVWGDFGGVSASWTLSISACRSMPWEAR